MEKTFQRVRIALTEKTGKNMLQVGGSKRLGENEHVML